MMLRDIALGDKIETSQRVDQQRTASHLGSGSLQVYATPAMVTFIEHSCRELIEPKLAQGQTSVGVEINVKHVAPTPLGATVSLLAEIVAIEGNSVTFKAQVRDEIEVIGEAEHIRVIIDVPRFQKRVATKSNPE